jgi:hypothetical protein
MRVLVLRAGRQTEPIHVGKFHSSDDDSAQSRTITRPFPDERPPARMPRSMELRCRSGQRGAVPFYAVPLRSQVSPAGPAAQLLLEPEHAAAQIVVSWQICTQRLDCMKLRLVDGDGRCNGHGQSLIIRIFMRIHLSPGTQGPERGLDTGMRKETATLPGPRPYEGRLGATR